MEDELKDEPIIRKRKMKKIFANLPLVPLKVIMKEMTAREIICLASSSEPMQKRVSKLEKWEKDQYVIYVNGEFSSIELVQKDITLPTGKYGLRTEGNWSALEYTGNVFQRVQEFIPCENVDLNLVLNNNEPANIKESFGFSIFKKLKKLVVKGGRMTHLDMNRITEMVDCDTTVDLTETEIPNDYRNNMLFKFKSVSYGDMYGTKIQDLYSLRNCTSLVMKKNSFTSKDINRFIKYWINCEHDMFLKFTFSSLRNQAVEEQMYAGIVSLSVPGLLNKSTLITAKHNKNRKNTVLCIIHETRIIEMYAIRPDQSIPMKPFASLNTVGREYGILKNLHHRDELIKEKRRWEDKRMEMENGWEDDELDEILDTVTDLSIEINKLNEQLTYARVDFTNGRARMKGRNEDDERTKKIKQANKDHERAKIKRANEGGGQDRTEILWNNVRGRLDQLHRANRISQEEFERINRRLESNKVNRNMKRQNDHHWKNELEELNIELRNRINQQGLFDQRPNHEFPRGPGHHNHERINGHNEMYPRLPGQHDHRQEPVNYGQNGMDGRGPGQQNHGIIIQQELFNPRLDELPRRRLEQREQEERVNGPQEADNQPGI